jgi:hypothetical protein
MMRTSIQVPSIINDCPKCKKILQFSLFGEIILKKVAVGTTFAVDFNNYMALDELH